MFCAFRNMKINTLGPLLIVAMTLNVPHTHFNAMNRLTLICRKFLSSSSIRANIASAFDVLSPSMHSWCFNKVQFPVKSKLDQLIHASLSFLSLQHPNTICGFGRLENLIFFASQANVPHRIYSLFHGRSFSPLLSEVCALNLSLLNLNSSHNCLAAAVRSGQSSIRQL